jgi:diguanylate cyclase (GGDEF)-like protein
LHTITDDFFFFDYLEDELPKKAKMYIKRFHRSERFYQLAITDFLTGCYTYRYMYQLIDDELGRSKRYGRRFSLIAIDIDNFPSLTKTYGRIIGDEYLRQIAKIMIGSLREIDSVARLNDHQFGLLLPETPTRGAEIVLSRLRKLFSDGVSVRNKDVASTFSAVLIHSDVADFTDASHLFAKAEELMERVIAAGGDSYIVYAPPEE